jgi:CDP-paratose 2-epimerase
MPLENFTAQESLSQTSNRKSDGNGKLRDFRSVVIFGGAGFIGSNLAHFLLRETKAKVHVFDNLSRQGSRHNLDWLQETAKDSGRLKITIGDVRNYTLVERAVRHATEIYHFAAQVAVTSSIEDPRTDFEVNAGGTLNILEAARKGGHKPFILYTSTNKVYGALTGQPLIAYQRCYRLAPQDSINESQPLNFHSPYGCSKGAADQYVRDYARIYGLPTVVFRMSCIAGIRQFGTEDQGWVAHFIYSALQKEPITIYGDGRQTRDVLWIGDLIEAMNAVRENLPQTAGEVFNLGGGCENTTSLLELMDSIEALTGRKMEYSFAPARPGDQMFYVTNHEKLTRMTGWKPRNSLDDTVRQIARWWKANQSLFGRMQAEAAQEFPSALEAMQEPA